MLNVSQQVPPDVRDPLLALLFVSVPVVVPVIAPAAVADPDLPNRLPPSPSDGEVVRPTSARATAPSIRATWRSTRTRRTMATATAILQQAHRLAYGLQDNSMRVPRV